MGTKRLFRRSLLGYRPREVDEVIAGREAALEDAKGKLADAQSRLGERDAQLAAHREELERGRRRLGELDKVCDRLAQRVVERERQLRRLRADLARARERTDESVKALGALGSDLETLRRLARAQATRIRMRALRDAAELTQRMRELESHPGEDRRALVESLDEAIGRIGANPEEDELDPVRMIAAANGHLEREPGEMFEGLVEVDVGPLSDFSQLVGFEDAASGIGAMSEVSVKRFKQGRATLAMRFRQPVELLRELEDRAPFVFRVRDRRSDRLVLDVDS